MATTTATTTTIETQGSEEVSLSPSPGLDSSEISKPSNTSTDPDTGTDINKCRTLIENLLSQCNVPLKKGTPLDPGFYRECQDILLSEYFKPSSSSPSQVSLSPSPESPSSESLITFFTPYLTLGVRMASTAYAHVSDTRTRIYVAHFTALLVCLDDIFPSDSRAPEVFRVGLHSEVGTEGKEGPGFNERFIRGLDQNNVVLEAVARLLRDTGRFFGRVQGNLIVTSALNYVTSLEMDEGIGEVKLRENSIRFALFCRSMSGISEAFAAFIFPPNIPFTTYIQSFPDLYIYENYINDVISFYKESLSSETSNLVSILSTTQPSLSKYSIVQQLIDETASANTNIRNLLGSDPSGEALDAYDKFRVGFVQFHVDSERYRLRELFGEGVVEYY